MENRDRTRDQGGQGQGNKPGQGGGQQGGREVQGGNQRPGQSGGQQGSREGQGGSQDSGERSNSKFVRNEGLATEGEDIRQEQGGSRAQGDYEYTGGRQGPGEIPNPEDQNDRGSRSGFDGNAAEKVGTDDDEGDEGFGADQNRKKDPNNQTRQSNPSPNQRRVTPSNDKTQ